jgi:hypothetical protein
MGFFFLSQLGNKKKIRKSQMHDLLVIVDDLIAVFYRHSRNSKIYFQLGAAIFSCLT